MNFKIEANDDDILWRYMDASKLLDLLISKKIVFPRYDKFEDNFEGYSINYINLIREKIANHPDRFEDENIEHSTNVASEAIKISLYYSYISCWHLNEYESAAMWKLYCTSAESIAIKTDVKSLKNVLGKYDNITFSKVNYNFNLNDLSIKDLNIVHALDPLVVKRESFDHEKEFRAIFLDSSDRESKLLEMFAENENNFDNHLKSNSTEKYSAEQNYFKKIENDLKNRDGVKSFCVEPQSFIKEIIVSPMSPSWFVNTLKELLEKLVYDIPVKQSKLYDLK